MIDTGQRPVLSVFRVAIAAPFLIGLALCYFVVPAALNMIGLQGRFASAGFVATYIVLAWLISRCPRCLASFAPGGSGSDPEGRTLRCRRCGLNLERNTYWTRPFTNPDRREVK